MQIINADDFRVDWLAEIPAQKHPKGNPGRKKEKRRDYVDIITAFDIETSKVPGMEHSIMYIWQWCFGDQYTVIGRTWQQFITVCSRIKQVLNGKWLVVFDHNLYYQFQFLAGIHEFQQQDVFAIDERKVLKCDLYNCIEMRCSYIHSNMSLKQYTDKMQVQHRKLSGDDFDYDDVRYPWTELTEQQMNYCINDVVGLVEAVTKQMTIDGDNLYTFPLTSTGYVRREAKREMKKIDHNYVHDMLPDAELYRLLRMAFRGGNTHASRFMTDRVLHDVVSFDRSSSYPDVLVNCKYPVSKFYHTGACSLDELHDIMDVRKRACVIRFVMLDVKLRDQFIACPYLAKAKCNACNSCWNDNGRVLAASYIETCCTDIDFRIIMQQYEYQPGSLQIIDLYHARYGYLPTVFTRLVKSLYAQKTELKRDHYPENSLDKIMYGKMKALLNSLYGMCAQDACKMDINFRKPTERECEKYGIEPDGTYFIKDELTEQAFEKAIEQYHKKGWLPYQWGVWVTAWARQRLQLLIDAVGIDFVYADTDSVKFVNAESHYAEIDEINEKLQSDSEKTGAYAVDAQGQIHYMGVYERDGDYRLFKTLGAKKYCFCKTDNPRQCEITIAGVAKEKGAAQLNAADGIYSFTEGDQLHDGFVFRQAGGLEAIYNDLTAPFVIQVDGHLLQITRNICLVKSRYTLGIQPEYSRLLNHIGQILDKMGDI